jgi:hypothetical protein
MKLHFVITIFFIYYITIKSNALNCIDVDQPIRIYAGVFKLHLAQQFINDNLKINNTYKECFVEIYINYLYKNMIINFDRSFSSYNLKTNQEVRIETWIQTFENRKTFDSANIFNVVVFKCNYADQCDHRFVLDQLDWLFKANYEQLVSAISPLLTSTNQYTGKTIHNYFSYLY